MKKELETKKPNTTPLTSDSPLKLTRSGIERYLDCPCCFYLSNKFGINRPPVFPFEINRAVDKLLKKEFDIHRNAKTTHPLMKLYGINAVPFEHPLMEEWRDTGLKYLHEPSNIMLSSVIDDIWINNKDELIVVDYRATARETEIDVDSDWHLGYKRRMDVYQWLLRKLGFKVTNTSYFLYCNAKTDREALNGKIEFDTSLIQYQGTDVWVEGIITEIKECLGRTYAPDMSDDCEYCEYVKRRASKTLVFV